MVSPAVLLIGAALVALVIFVILPLFKGGDKNKNTTSDPNDTGLLSAIAGTRGDIAAGDLPPTSPTPITGKVCEGMVAELVCHGTKVIRMKKARYWRSPNSTCPAPGGVCNGLDVLTKVSQECNGKKECSFTVNNKKWGSPCVGVVKEFEWEYVCA
jgi:hypothetical protein